MDLKIYSKDPFKILETTKEVVLSSVSVFISQEKIQEQSVFVLKVLEQGINEMGEGFNLLGNIKDNIQIVFIEDVVNFCFWSDLDQMRWRVEYNKGDQSKDGWSGLQACFIRALKEGVPVLDAKYLSNIKLEDVQKIFRSSTEQEIPLIEERWKNLLEAGRVLLKKFDGEFINLVKEADYDAVKIVDLIIKNFASFLDKSILNGKEIIFLKRAQIVANDLSYISTNDEKLHIKNLDQLTAFADYKIPQLLRGLGIIYYSDELARKINSGTHLPKDSREEVEIRASTIWAIELIKQELGNKYTSSQIDNALWFLSQKDKEIGIDLNPYHRTRTIFY